LVTVSPSVKYDPLQVAKDAKAAGKDPKDYVVEQFITVVISILLNKKILNGE